MNFKNLSALSYFVQISDLSFYTILIKKLHLIMIQKNSTNNHHLFGNIELKFNILMINIQKQN